MHKKTAPKSESRALPEAISVLELSENVFHVCLQKVERASEFENERQESVSHFPGSLRFNDAFNDYKNLCFSVSV
jgi:hypothetical protein